jgi:hypothetical protein
MSLALRGSGSSLDQVVGKDSASTAKGTVTISASPAKAEDRSCRVSSEIVSSSLN